MGILDPAPTQANFSLLGLLLGGRGYASNWLGQRDTLTQQANERARVGTQAQGLLASPEYKAAVTDPSQQAQFNLWAKMQPDFSAMGNNLLSQKIGAAYQDQATRLSDQLERERMGINVDDQLKMDAVKRQRDLQDTQNQLGALAKMPGMLGNNALFQKITGQAPPADYGISAFDPQTGVPQLNLIPHSPTWMKAADEIAPLKDSADSLKILSDMASNVTPYNQGIWNATRNGLLENIIKGKGSYDEGLKDLMNQLIPDSSRTSTDFLGDKKTQLDMQLKLAQARAVQTAQKWGVNLDDMPSSSLRLGGIMPTTPPPTTDPNAAVKQLQKQADQVPATTRQGRYNPRAGGIQLDQSPGYKPTTRSRTGQLLQ